MATAKKAAAKAATKKTAPKAAPKTAASSGSALKPIKETFNKTTLVAHLAQTSGVEPKNVKAVVAALEATILASIAKKGAGAFTWPGVLKVSATHGKRPAIPS